MEILTHHMLAAGSDTAKLRDHAVQALLSSDDPNAALALASDPSMDVRDRAIRSALSFSVERKQSVLDGPTLRDLMVTGSDDVAQQLVRMIRVLPTSERLRASDLNAESRDSQLASMLNVKSFGVDPREGFWPVVQRIEAVAPGSAEIANGVANAAIDLIRADELPTAEFIAWWRADMATSAWERVLNFTPNDPAFSVDDTWLGRATSAERAQRVRLAGDMKSPFGEESTALGTFSHDRLGIHSEDLVALVMDDAAPWLSRSWALVELTTVAPMALTTDLVPTLARVLSNAGEHLQISLFARNPDAPELASDILDAIDELIAMADDAQTAKDE